MPNVMASCVMVMVMVAKVKVKVKYDSEDTAAVF